MRSFLNAAFRAARTSRWNGVITATLSPAGLATRHSVSNESRVIDWAPTRSASFCC